jgi:hypothetical protein
MKYRPTSPLVFARPSGYVSERESKSRRGVSTPPQARTNALAVLQWVSPSGVS